MYLEMKRISYKVIEKPFVAKKKKKNIVEYFYIVEHYIQKINISKIARVYITLIERDEQITEYYAMMRINQTQTITGCSATTLERRYYSLCWS